MRLIPHKIILFVWIRYVLRIGVSIVLLLFFISPIQAKTLDKVMLKKCENKFECASQSVVSVLPDWPVGFSRNEEPEGSGIVIGSDLIATADHVLGPAKTARIRTINGEILNAQIIMRNPATDIAFLKIPKKMPTFEFSESYALADKTCAIGNSFGLDVSLTCGVVSAKNMSGVGFNKIEDFIQTDASVNPGMSGGALVDENGKLIGMLSAIFTRKSDANIGVNFAVSIELLKSLLADFSDDGILSIRESGLLLRPTKPEPLGGLIGAEVMRVETGSSEEKAGIKRGDVIYSVNDKRTKRAGRYEAIVALTSKAKIIKVSLSRNDKALEIIIPAN